jgi:hypothetical protein
VERELVGIVSSPRVAVVVLNHDGSKWLPKCLSSVTRTGSPNVDVYLVDNGSTDGSVTYAHEHFPDVKTIVHSTNLGFAAGYTRALKRIKADYFVLLNNDTEVLSPDWIQSLVKVAVADPRVAAVACKMVSMNNPGYLDSVGGMGIPFWRGFLDIGREERDERQYDSGGFEPFSFCGGAALIKWAVFEKAGGFDEMFFMYFEDVDLSWRLRLLGYQIGFAPDAKVAHFFSGSAGIKTLDVSRLYYCHRNLLRAILKNCGSSLAWALCNYFLYSLILTTGFSVLEPRKAVKIVKALLWNLVNLRNTYSRRLAVQASRKSGESKVLAIMYPRIRRHHSLEHPTLRRILNILFEHSQSIDRFI